VLRKISGQPLLMFDSVREATEGAQRALLEFGTEQAPYQCTRCRKWHLAPKNRHTPSHTCRYCVGSDGKPKESYANEEDATRRAQIVERERGISLRVYLCDYGGWHLTKSSGGRSHF